MGTRVRVIAAQGATLRGPAELRLSEAQHALRSHIVGPWKKGATAVLDGGQEISLKYGEEITIENGEGRLNTALFEDITPAKKAKPATVDDMVAGGADSLGGGDDTQSGGDPS